MLRKENTAIAQEMEQWFTSCLGCIAGAREFIKGRYTITVFDESMLPDCLIKTYEQFVLDLQAYKRVGSLFVFNIPALYEGQGKNAHDALQTLATYMSFLTDTPAETLLHGGNFNKKLLLPCPVTGQQVLYEDFDAIAFCPQAYHKIDPLYDPLMAAPYPCVNFNSDLFGFAMYVRDTCLKKHRCEVYQLGNPEIIFPFLVKCGKAWQHMARTTITNYIAMTDTALCPTYLSENERQWFAFHQDPAFAETTKSLFAHDMPVVYTEKVIAKWMQFFTEGICPPALSVTQPGRLV